MLAAIAIEKKRDTAAAPARLNCNSKVVVRPLNINFNENYSGRAHIFLSPGRLNNDERRILLASRLIKLYRSTAHSLQAGQTNITRSVYNDIMNELIIRQA